MARHLKIVNRPDATTLKPPRTLGEAGANLWSRIVEQYQVDDAGGRELLTLCCQSLDRAEALRAKIDEDGEIVRTKTGVRDHPALKHEIQNRSFVAKCLSRLGVALEAPSRPVGRPLSGGIGIDDESRRRLLGEET
jgi:hypothetical protein